MNVVIRGRRYKVCRKDLGRRTDGHCDAPDVMGKEISVHERLRGQTELETFVHEFLHAAFWDLGEDAIDEAARDVSRALWKIGYRKP